MATLAGTAAAGGRLIPTSYDGVFVQDVPIEELEALQAEIEDLPEDDRHQGVWLVIDRLMRGEDGSKFTDLPSVEEVKRLSMHQMAIFTDAYHEYLESATKKMRATAGS